MIFLADLGSRSRVAKRKERRNCLLKGLDFGVERVYNLGMARFRVMQTRNGREAVQVGPVTRRFNGALSVQDEHVSLAVGHLRTKAAPGERVVQGPTSDVEFPPIAVVLISEEAPFEILTWIERQ